MENNALSCVLQKKQWPLKRRDSALKKRGRRWWKFSLNPKMYFFSKVLLITLTYFKWIPMTTSFHSLRMSWPVFKKEVLIIKVKYNLKTKIWSCYYCVRLFVEMCWYLTFFWWEKYDHIREILFFWKRDVMF